MDRQEAILTLRKNKLDMEHEELLQDRNVIVITEVGTPITLINVIAVAQPYVLSSLTSIILASVVFMGITEWFRRRNKRAIVNKRDEIDSFIQELQSESR
jgi:hypothetical protein